MRLTVIFLGTTVAEQSTKYGFTICSAGWSPALRSLVRIYPLPWPLTDCKAERWAEYDLEVERPRHDARRESWRLVDDAPASLVRRHTRAEVLSMLQPRCGLRQSIAALNDTRSSLGLIFCEPYQVQLVVRDSSSIAWGKPDMDWLFGPLAEAPIQKADFTKWPYVRFADVRGSHCLQLLDRGAYVLLARGGPIEDISKRLLLQRAEYGHVLLVGNQCNRPTSWLVIAVFPVLPHDWREDRAQYVLPFSCVA